MSGTGNNKGDWPTVLIGLLGFGLIAYAATEALKLMGHEEMRYKCPNCEGTIKLNVPHCPHCNSPLLWNQQ